jgi:hypothetical protein
MRDHTQTDEIWEHGDNIYPRFVWKYCKCTKKSKQKERLVREEVATKCNVIHDIDSDDEELLRALHASREEQFARAARER